MHKDLESATRYWNFINVLKMLAVDKTPFQISDMFLAEPNELVTLKQRLVISGQYDQLACTYKQLLSHTDTLPNENTSILELADSLYNRQSYRPALSLYIIGFFFDDKECTKDHWAFVGISRCLYVCYGLRNEFINDLKTKRSELF